MSHGRQGVAGTSLLTLGALGVVFGDIGTSPLYAFKACLSTSMGLDLNPATIMGVLSLMVWSLLLVVGGKYIGLLLRADNGGEGGTFALLALAGVGSDDAPRSRWRTGLLVVAVIGAALLYGDGIITPAISVLSAMEGMVLDAPHHGHWVVLAAMVVILLVFATQRLGSGRIGWITGPLMLIWFIVIGVLGLRQILVYPDVLASLWPGYAIDLFAADPMKGLMLLGAVVLCVTGAEALYADMGHFGRRAISIAWWFVVCPCLLLSYFGQGAVVLHNAQAAKNPFYGVVPPDLLVPMVVLATLAAIVASQAIISGVFSVTRQIAQRHLLPSLRVIHTSMIEGQVFIPTINRTLAIGCLLIVLLFQSSDALADAYGLAVTAVMAISTTLFAVVSRRHWRWPWWAVLPVVGVMVVIDGAFLIGNVGKIPAGGWLPLLVAFFVLTIIVIWHRGLKVLVHSRFEDGLPLDRFMDTFEEQESQRTPGTGVFIAMHQGMVPVALRKLQRHNPVLPDTVVVMYLQALSVPRVTFSQRLQLEERGHGVWSAIVRYGYLETPDLPSLMRFAAERGVPTDPATTTYWVHRESVAPGAHAHLPRWQATIFAVLLRNAVIQADLLELPPRRTVEIGLRSSL